MRSSRYGIFPAGVLLAGLVLAVSTVTAMPPAAAGPVATQAASGCIQVAATIALPQASGQIAVDPRTDTAYVPSGGHRVYVINGHTDTVTGTIPVGRQAGVIAVNPDTDTIYVVNELDQTMSVISGRTGTVTATIPVGRDPQGVAVNPLAGTVYVTNEVSGTVSVISCWRPLTRLFLQRDRLTPTSAASVTSLAWVRPASRLRCRGPPCCGSDRSRRFAFAGVCGPGQPGATARRSPPTPA